MKYYYLAIFHETEKDEKGYWVEFPDLDGAFTQGDDMDDAYKMAEDCLGLVLLDYKKIGKEFPDASNPSDIVLEKNDRLVLVSIDLPQYEKKLNSKSIKKTLSIPEWLNDLAEKNNINFSKTLQDALKEKLGVS